MVIQRRKKNMVTFITRDVIGLQLIGHDPFSRRKFYHSSLIFPRIVIGTRSWFMRGVPKVGFVEGNGGIGWDNGARCVVWQPSAMSGGGLALPIVPRVQILGVVFSKSVQSKIRRSVLL